MKLNRLLSGVKYSTLANIANTDIEVWGLSSHAQSARAGELFVALKGTRFDGHKFLDYVAGRGITVAVVEETPLMHDRFIQIKVDDSRRILSILARNFYKDPSRKIKVIGITGTNGKTTVSYLLESILRNAAVGTGLIGTIQHKIGRETIEPENTTPDALTLNQLLGRMVEEELPYCVMEVSSHSLDQYRVEDIRFKTAVFTNLSHEHLDYHKTLANYLKAKLRLFKNLEPDACAVVNKDSPHCDAIVVALNTHVVTYGIEKTADIMAENCRTGLTGTHCTLVTPKGNLDIKTPLIGQYNVANILAAAATAYAEGFGLKAIKKGIEKLRTVPGRMERIACGQDFAVFIDYAHTEDALQNVLSTLRSVSNKKILLVFGCGGDRDKAKRPLMGKVAAQLADFTIITSDNPRSENPDSIARDIERGFKGSTTRYRIIVDRYKAIKRALTTADEDMIVLIAGKGHERHQIFADNIAAFDDRQVVREILKGR
jgi:UDP-N-acetylmuramoyl-L-alanyl-D-glutamate--2,6-diaminopimelate ligase